MSRCIDYPCCGHEDGGCPNADGTFNCAQCGRKLPRKSMSAICPRCHKRNADHYDDLDDEHSMDY